MDDEVEELANGVPGSILPPRGIPEAGKTVINSILEPPRKITFHFSLPVVIEHGRIQTANFLLRREAGYSITLRALYFNLRLVLELNQLPPVNSRDPYRNGPTSHFTWCLLTTPDNRFPYAYTIYS